MSLAMYAAPFDNNTNNQDNYISKKRQTHNKTQKANSKENFELFDTNKVNSILEKINDEDNELGDFNPPPMPSSSGVNKTISTEQIHNNSKQHNDLMFRIVGQGPQPIYDDNKLELNDYKNYATQQQVEEYYKKVLPTYNSQNNQLNYNNQINKYDNLSNDVLMQKINYMIHLLEEKQDEKTNNVTEEIILYSFLGIFIIFVIDSFARVGKYVR
jgi:hypothetical protein